MTKEPLIKLPIDTPSESFKTHLEGNERILFSAPFGTGKTYFLKHFFQFDDIVAKYNVFHLFPVNYQVASNEDVFELVKYDLLYNMLLKGWIDTKNEEIPKSLAVQSYLMTKSPTLLSNIMKCIPFHHIDKASEASGHIMAFINDFTKHYDELNKGDFEKIKDFVTQITNRSGSIYEMDAISNLIYDTLQAEKGENGEKENVLIIDDFDRIDPEHIFRLLNVFSAHFDLPTEEENKFGFDKVIFVCDVENIRNIFAAKYGQQTDFSGYIDKFYSSTIYAFDNVQEAVNILSNWASVFGKNNMIPPYYFGLIDTFGRKFLQWFFLSGSINLRQFFNLTLSNLYSFDDYRRKRRSQNVLYEYNLLFIDLAYILLIIFGADKQKLIGTLEKTSKKNLPLEGLDYFARNIIPILKFNELNYSPKSIRYLNETVDIDMQFILDTRINGNMDFVYAKGEITNTKGDLKKINSPQEILLLMKDAVEIMDKYGLI